MKKPDWPYIIILSSGIALAVAFLMALFSSQANASYFTVGVGQSKFELSGIWSGEGDGYESKQKSSTAVQLGFGGRYSWFNVEGLLFHSGNFQYAPLWGNPDDRHCPSCYKTTSSFQSGSVYGFEGTFRPRLDIGKSDLHLILGASYYRATWEVNYLDPNDGFYQQKYTTTFSQSTNSVSPVIGLGVTFGDFSVDFKSYTSASTDGYKYRNLGGGGAYKSFQTITLNWKF